MKNIAASLAVPSLLASLLVGCISDSDTESPLGDDPATDPFGPAPTFKPRSCKAIADHAPGTADGEQTLYYNSDASLPWKAYCADMQGTPREYLSLETGTGVNTSMYASATKSVVTSYQRVRIDPESFTIDIGDATFATSNGSVVHDSNTIVSMPYGVAMGCGATATANINLRGTSFRLENAFPTLGVNATATMNLSADRKVLDMAVTGSCGFTAQAPWTNPVSDGEQLALRLAYFR